MNKKGQMSGAVWGLVGVGVAFVVVTLVLAFGSDILDDTQSDFITNTANCGRNSTGGTAGTISYSACGSGFNTTYYGLSGLSKFGSKLPLIAGVIVAVIIIGLLIAGFMGYVSR